MDFDNLLISNDRRLADSWAKDTFDLKVQRLDTNSANLLERMESPLESPDLDKKIFSINCCHQSTTFFYI